MYKISRMEEWPINSGRFMLKEHCIRGSVSNCPWRCLTLDYFHYVTPHSLNRQLKVYSSIPSITSMLLVDENRQWRLWTRNPDNTQLVLDEDPKFHEWCLNAIGEPMLREYISSVFYVPRYDIERIGFTTLCNVKGYPRLCAQFKITTPVANRYNLYKNADTFDGHGSVINSDGVMREYEVNVYTRGYGRLQANASFFIYLPIHDILTNAQFYDTTGIKESFDKFNEIPPYKSNQKEYHHEY